MKPGDIVENRWASEDNPQRNGILIKQSGAHLTLTDGRGDVWTMTKNRASRLKVIGHVTLSPIAEAQDAVSRKHVWWAYRNYFGVQYPSEDGFCRVIEKLPSLPIPGRSEEDWTRADNELPPNGVLVLWYAEEREGVAAGFFIETVAYRAKHYRGYMDNYLYWMPLAKPPPSSSMDRKRQ